MRRFDTAEPTQRVLIHVTDPDREVQRRHAVVESGAADLGRPTHSLAYHHSQRSQVGIGRSQPAAMRDGDRQHSGDLAGEGDRAGVGRVHRGLRIDSQVYPPVTAEGADRFIASDQLTDDRRGQAGARRRSCEKPTEEDNGGNQVDGIQPSPPPTASPGYSRSFPARRVLLSRGRLGIC